MEGETDFEAPTLKGIYAVDMNILEGNQHHLTKKKPKNNQAFN